MTDQDKAALPIDIDHNAATAALQWYLDHGIDEAIADASLDAFAAFAQEQEERAAKRQASQNNSLADAPTSAVNMRPSNVAQRAAPQPIESVSNLVKSATESANNAKSLDELKQSVSDFNGLEIKKTASQIVMSDGQSDADIMVIIEAPLEEDDRAGKALLGREGALFDKALSCIHRSRLEENAPDKSLYIAPLLNWRPPGGRSASANEIAMSLPFLERHIALIQPKILFILGAAPTQNLLGKTQGITRMRKADHLYTTRTQGLEDALKDIPAIVSYAPSALLTTPLQKKAFWQDLLKLTHHASIMKPNDP